MPDSAPDASSPRITPAAAALLGTILLISVGFVGFSLLRDNPEETNAAKVPAVGQGLVALGSDLKAVDGITASGCDGEPVAAAAPSCTVAQSDLSRRTTIVPQDGVVRAWTVRGASGSLSLQILRTQGSQISEVARSASADVPTTGPHRFPANLSVRKGDIVALQLDAGSAIGMRPAPQAVIASWAKPVSADSGPGRPGLRREMLLRTELAPG